MAKKATTKKAAPKADPIVKATATPKSQLGDVVTNLEQCMNVLSDCNKIEFGGRNTVISSQLHLLKKTVAVLARIAR